MLNNPYITNGSVVDLINQETHTWKADLVRAYYPFPVYEEILQLPLPKTNTRGDKLLWKHSKSGDAVCHRVNHVESKVWKPIWRIKTPQKICTFVWKLLHDSLPTL